MAYQHSDVVWYNDGNIVLECEGVAFRVFQGLLAGNSPIFADMFTVPQLPETQETYEGVPLVHMPDGAKDIANFLKVIHDSRFQAEWIANPTFSVTASVLRLGTKYEVLHLRLTATRQLQRLFPTTLSEFDAVWFDYSSSWESPHVCFQLANLCRELDLLAILPSILYRCVSTSADTHISAGISDDSGHSELSLINKLACLEGLAKLLVLQCTRVYPLLPPYNRPCDDTENCIRLGRGTRRFFADRCEKGYCIMLHRNISDLFGKCDKCKADFRAALEGPRGAIWDLLPSLFGLPPWDDLRQQLV